MSSKAKRPRAVKNDPRFGARLCTHHPLIRWEELPKLAWALDPSYHRKMQQRGSNAKRRRRGAPRKR